MEDRLTSSGRQVDVNRRQVISSAAVAQTTLMSERAIFQGRRRSVQVSPSPATSLRRRRSSFQGPATSAVLQREEGSFRKRRTSVREAAIPLATDDVDELFSQGSSAPSSSVPSFREEWSPVFAEDRYQHMLPSIQGFCWVLAVYFLASSSWKCQSLSTSINLYRPISTSVSLISTAYRPHIDLISAYITLYQPHINLKSTAYQPQSTSINLHQPHIDLYQPP